MQKHSPPKAVTDLCFSHCIITDLGSAQLRTKWPAGCTQGRHQLQTVFMAYPGFFYGSAPMPRFFQNPCARPRNIPDDLHACGNRRGPSNVIVSSKALARRQALRREVSRASPAPHHGRSEATGPARIACSAEMAGSAPSHCSSLLQ